MSKKISKEFAIKYFNQVPFDCNSCRALGFCNCDGEKEHHNYTCARVTEKIREILSKDLY